MATQKIYSDLDITFRRTPVKGDVSVIYDEQSVIRSIRSLILTNPRERLFQPNIGSSLNALLFEPLTSLTASQIEDEVTRMVNNYEPRATIYKLFVTALPNDNSFKVSLFVFIGNNTEPTAIDLILQRTR